MHPPICPARFICVRRSASTVQGILGLTTSTAASGATRGMVSPQALATSTAFSIRRHFSSRVGAGLKATSVSSSRRPAEGRSITTTCDIMRPVRSPHSWSSTLRRNDRVSIIPFMYMSASPRRTMATARRAAV